MSNTQPPNDEITVLRNEVKELKADLANLKEKIGLIGGTILAVSLISVGEKQMSKELVEVIRAKENEVAAAASAAVSSDAPPQSKPHPKPAPADCKQQ
jgi:hypothetical protein